MKKIELSILNGKKITITKGDNLLSVIEELQKNSTFPILAAKVDNSIVSLNYIPENDAIIEPVTFLSKEGKEVYRITVAFVLYMAANELYDNSRLVIRHSFGGGSYYDYYTDIPVNQEIIDSLSDKMREIIELDLPLNEKTISKKSAVTYFKKKAQSEKVRLIENSDIKKVTIHEGKNFSNIGIYPLAPSTGFISQFKLKTYYPGFILQLPEKENFKCYPKTGYYPKLFKIFRESKIWGKILNVSNVGRLNQVINNNGTSELIKIAESLHEKKIAQIADEITKRKEDVRLILISGPSAAGKTTFSKRLSINLRVNGIRPIAISMDNYFVDREKCPRDENGEYDFEAVEAINIKLFNEHLSMFLEGEDVGVPKFDFESGKSIPNFRQVRLEDDQILIVEGIHGLNGRLTSSIPEKNKMKIYISALTQLSIDDHNRIPTTDTRILRRMIRDKKYRNYTASETLSRFKSVIKGEERHIFPFQESADIMFNSSLVYELALLKSFAVPILLEIEKTDKTYTEAQRLLKFLDFFKPVPASEIPPTSILREFIGGSSFKY